MTPTSTSNSDSHPALAPMANIIPTIVGTTRTSEGEIIRLVMDCTPHVVTVKKPSDRCVVHTDKVRSFKRSMAS